uniref:G domain-containing protein n=1 Tax=Panagrolaimus sp. ES5 TaxID=591445 RepID=A0AC34G330_9BILA
MPREPMNVLLIGQTGAGKSTFINSIANYLTYETLKDAIKENSPVVPIPTTFNVLDKNDEYVEFTVGVPDKDEGKSSSQSRTKKPKVYSFECNGEVLNFVDTPGIGDCEGVEKDDENTRMILTALTAFPKLHGICILLKSPDSKLTEYCKYCLTEMLMYIHNDAIKNIVFVFTHTGFYSYKPGAARLMLKDYLNYLKDKKPGLQLTEKFFCIESEAFLHQCLYNKNPEYCEKRLSVVEESWDHSRKTAFEILRYFKNLEPHTVKDSITVNEARALILVLIPTLGTTTRRNQCDMSYYTLNRDDVIHKIRTTQKIPANEIINIDIPYPRTVCTSQNCIGFNDKKGTTYYKTVCHGHCYLEGIPIASFPEEGLKECQAMNKSFNCTTCKCSYKMHMHIKYEQQIGTNNSFLFTVAAAIVGSISGLFFGKSEEKFYKTKREAEEELKEHEKNLTFEQEKITDALSTFAAFLKSCAIWTYNEDIESQLQMQIRSEKRSAEETKNNDVVNRLEAVYKSYVEKHQLLNSILEKTKCNSNISTDVIANLKKELFDLPENGAIIKESFKKSFDISSNNKTGTSFF